VPQATARKTPTATAFFHAGYGAQSIDTDNGILRGVKLMEVGKVATFSGPDGQPKSVTITQKHISALLSHAGNRAIPIHWTHDWHDKGDGAELDARIGALKAFRTDEAGNLIADAYLKAGDRRDSILWAAEHNPEDTMFSAVFNYSPADPDVMPMNFRAADIVPCGAATTALFSDSTETTTTPTMDINELIAALADPKVQDAVNAIIKSHKSDSAAAEEAAVAPAAEMEEAAGVTDEDKKPEDEQKPALMRAAIRVARATSRQIKASTEQAATMAEARFTKSIGAGKFPGIAGTTEVTLTASDKFNAAVKELTDKGVKPAQAMLAAIEKHGDLYREANATLFCKPVSR